MPHPSRRHVLGLAATLPLAGTGALTLGAGTAHAADSAYVMAYFTESTTMLEAAWNRLKSYNHPARYVRHSAYAGRIDEYPFDPYPDSQWKLVPGLADSSGVSFQSVNFPTRYLRHYNYELRLDANDGTSTFAADATFHRVAGLADSSWSSFRSYNNPTRYIRHANFALRIDPVSTSTERQDATFHVGY
nr:AbfB domain-containing protein [Kutzneria buriramensis]WKX13429.1 AbfB domain-containing protein [Kutzneria buriramensis]